MATDYIVLHVYPKRLGEFAATVDRHFARLQDGQAYLFDEVPPSFFEGARR